jgi:L-threonylcarbamoyladenylate synthase
MNILLSPELQGHETASVILRDGGVIAYPTEAVFGLGCDPYNRDAVFKLLQLKSRRAQKGLILIASSFEQLKSVVAHEELSKHQLNEAFMTWPGPYTWIFPASPSVPSWIRGDFSTIAVRVTRHPVARALCETYGGPIVSTSANRDGCVPARTYQETLECFPKGLNGILKGEIGKLIKPTQIRDIQTGKIVRFGSA